jgi:hypothetical protein
LRSATKSGNDHIYTFRFGLATEINYTELDRFLDETRGGKKRRNAIDGLYRLSSLQQGMLFHGLYDLGGGTYLDQFSCDMVGVDLAIFKKSWAAVLNKHSILRSAFYPDTFNLPVQCVFREVELPIELLDYRNLNEADQDLAIKEYKAADNLKSFDFRVAPLMRIALMRITDERYIMLWTYHHILVDGWSMPLLMEDFMGTYELLSAGNEIIVGEEDRYEDYIRYIETS